MIKPKHIVLTLCAATSLAIMSMAPEKSSSGAPASHTGAPGDGTCATGGCHDDNALNAGTAQLSIDLGSVTKYVPGQTYPVTVRITDPSVMRFGFEIVALTGDNGMAGSFKITDTYRTQITKNQYALFDRHYVTYSYDGTDAVVPGKGEWTMNWTAPATNIGPVTFYASGVSANDNENDKGDHVYTINKVIQAGQ